MATSMLRIVGRAAGSLGKLAWGVGKATAKWPWTAFDIERRLTRFYERGAPLEECEPEVRAAFTQLASAAGRVSSDIRVVIVDQAEPRRLWWLDDRDGEKTENLRSSRAQQDQK